MIQVKFPFLKSQSIRVCEIHPIYSVTKIKLVKQLTNTILYTAYNGIHQMFSFSQKAISLLLLANLIAYIVRT